MIAASKDLPHAAPSAIESQRPSQRESGVTRRVVVISLLLAVVFGYAIPIIDVKLSNTFLGAAHLPPGAVAVLLVLLLVINPLLRLFAAAWAFSRNEVLTVYITCLFSCLVPGHGAENFFIPNLLGPFYYATPANRWLDFLQPHLHSWFTPALASGGKYNDAGRVAVESWYVGLRVGEQVIPWGAWLVPLVAWGTFIFVSYTMLGCLSVMLRAQWAEREALAFPLLRLPLEMTEDVDRRDGPGLGRFFRDKLMWSGFGIAVCIQLFNGLNLYFPDVPTVPLSINTATMFTEAPWNQMGPLLLQVYPLAVGITYLLTSEVSFSLWFFYWFIKLQLIGAYYLGFVPSTLPAAIGHTMGAKTFASYQQVGVYLAYVAIVLWTAREHLRHIVRRAFRRAAPGPEEAREALSYPVAFWGFVLSFAFMVAWSVAAGIRADIAIGVWMAYLIIAIALTRVVVEGGLLFVQQGWTPLGTFAQLFNSGPGTWLAPHSIVPATFVQASLITDMRAFLMPSFVQSFRLAHERKINAKPLLALIAVVILITLVMSLWMNVRLGYETSGLKLDKWFAVGGAQKPAVNANEMIKGARDVSWLNWMWLGFGAAATYGMVLARSRFLWFPLHPIGYLMCLTYPMHRLWFSIFLGWLCKSLISRFGGSEIYRAMRPLFLGVVLGDVAMMLLWLIIDGWQGRTGHQLMPG
ncbi:MAG TPA: DUF6785 family protein [Abditibacteriaceae bacterium]|nr:DUF6785 family protein [Abditibacteriaceae bacterium]